MKAEHSIVRQIFRQTMTASVSGRLAESVSILVDGVVVGSFLGVNALAAYGLVTPLKMIYAMCGDCLSGGTRNLYSTLAGSGKIDEANSTFTLGFIMSLAISVSMMALTYLFMSNLAVMLGAKGSNSGLLPLVCQYLAGFVIGVPLEQSGKFIAGFMPIDSDNRRVVFGTIVLGMLCVAGDFAVVLLFNGSMLLLGLASALSRFVYFAVMSAHFLRKDRMLMFSLKELTGIRDKIYAIFVNSVPSVVSYVSNALGIMFIYNILSAAASSVYIATYSVYMSFNALLGVSYCGISDTTWTLSGIYYGEEDRNALNTLQITAITHGIFITVCITILFTLASGYVARIYVGTSNDPQALALAAEAITVLALNTPLSMLVFMFEYYMMGTGKITAANIYGFMVEFGVIIPAVYVMVKLVGGRGAWLAYPVTMLIMIAYALMYIYFWKVGDTFSVKRLLLNAEFAAISDKEVTISANTDLEVMGMSHIAWLFCKENNIGRREAYVLALCIEELGINIINHGFSDGKPHSIDMRMLVKDNECILRIRDDCRPFNPVERYKMIIEYKENFAKNIGIRLVMNMSRDVKYLSTMATNNLIIKI